VQIDNTTNTVVAVEYRNATAQACTLTLFMNTGRTSYTLQANRPNLVVISLPTGQQFAYSNEIGSWLSQG
jgi:hypothetical protein